MWVNRPWKASEKNGSQCFPYFPGTWKILAFESNLFFVQRARCEPIFNLTWSPLLAFFRDPRPTTIAAPPDQRSFSHNTGYSSWLLSLIILVGGWATPLKILVNWDDYSQYMGKFKKWQPNHQPVISHQSQSDLDQNFPIPSHGSQPS